MAGDYLYAGAWLDDSGKAGGGIRIYEIQIDGTLKLVSHVAEDIAAGYIAVSQDGNNLYAVNEIKRRPDCVHTEGGIYAYEMNQTNGTLKELNHVSSCGVFPNYLVPTPDNRCLYAVNYGSEDMVVRSRKNEEGEWILEEVYEESGMVSLDILKDGSLSPVRDLHIFSGNPSRYFEWFQAASHPHCIGLDPTGNMLLSADRGCDQILTCQYDEKQKKFYNVHIYKTMHGIGPRNCIFHPTLFYVYVVGEVKPYVTVYKYEPLKAELMELESYLTADEGMEYKQEGEFFSFAHPSDIKIHPNGKMLYVANRGPDTIACFEILEENGKLRHLTDVSSEGKWPWSMEFTQDGKYLYVANKMSGHISMFSMDEKGIPHFSGKTYEAERTVCLKCVKI